jgi:hypothetical protein
VQEASDAWVIITARRVPHSSAPRARGSAVLAISASRFARPQARRHDTRSWGRSSPAPRAAPFLRTDLGQRGHRACLELIHQQQVIVAGQREVIMRGRKRSRLGPPTRTADVVPHVQDATIDAGGQTDAALRALVRLLAKQAAREVFEQSVSDSDCSFEEGRE